MILCPLLFAHALMADAWTASPRPSSAWLAVLTRRSAVTFTIREYGRLSQL